MYSSTLGIVCIVSFVIAFSIYTSYEKSSIVKDICFLLSLFTLFLSMALSVGFDILAKKVYVSSIVDSSETVDLLKIEGTNCYLAEDDDKCYYCYIGEINNKVQASVDLESTDVYYNNYKTPQVTREKVIKKYYKKWLFLKNGFQDEESVEYDFVIPNEESVLHEENEERASAGP